MSTAERLTWPNRSEPNRRYTVKGYLEFDEKAVGRWEYAGGRILPVGAPELVNQLDPQFRAGASVAHCCLQRVLNELIFIRLYKGCEAYTSDARVYTPLTQSYSYPDVVVQCDTPECLDASAMIPSLTNPIVLVENLSDATSDYDRSGKFMRYSSIKSLQHYLLVDSRKVLVEIFTRSETSWLYSQATQAHKVVELTAVQCSLTVGELYEGLDLPTVQETMPPDEVD